MRRCFLACLALLLITLSGCTAPRTEHGTFVCAGDWDMPPAFHGNPWSPGGVNVLQGWIYEPLFLYVPATGEWRPRLGTSFTESPDHLTLSVQVRPNAYWHDGARLTSDDVRTTFYLAWLKGMPIWHFLERIDCPSDTTVVFHFKRAAPAARVLALTEWITSPTHLFSAWSQPLPAVMAARESGHPSPDELKLRESMYRYHPDMPIGTGPFRLTRASFSDLVAEKFTQHYDAAHVQFDQLRIMRWGQSNQIAWSYLIAGDLDAAGAACPFDLTAEILKRNPQTRLYLPSDRSEFGIVFNCTRAPFSDVHFRQAVAYLVDKDLVRQISNTYATTTPDYNLGLLYSYRQRWLGDGWQTGMTDYHTDADKARALLEQAGLRQSAAGQWCRSDGRPLTVEILAPNGYNDFVLMAEAIASQLTAHGLSAQVRALPLELYGSWLLDHKFDMAASFGVQLFRLDDPASCFDVFYQHDGLVRMASALPRVVKDADGRDFDTEQAVERLEGYLPPAEQQRLSRQLAWVTNEYLPFLTCYEKNLMLFVMNGRHVAQWPAPEDPIWSSCSTGLETVYATLMTEGKLGVAP
jgi:peptide/nickel transport system substrate-binding protein